jgi:hypothetical protein
MAFSTKHLLFCMAVVAFGVMAMFSDSSVVGQLFELLTLAVLIATAYRAWLSHGELRAFRVGFLCWAVLYFLLVKRTADFGVNDLIGRAFRAFHPTNAGQQPWVFYDPNFSQVCHSLILLLFGLIGGWVTVYLYRKHRRVHEP